MPAKTDIGNTKDATALLGLLGLLADIRAAVGDPKGKLMQDELVARCRKLHEIERAAQWMWKVKGRHNSQLATSKMGELLGKKVYWPGNEPKSETNAKAL